MLICVGFALMTGGNGHRNRARRGQIQLGKQQEDTDLVYEGGKEGD